MQYPREWRRDLVWGIRLGAVIGVGYGLVAVALIAVRGTPDVGMHPAMLFLLYVLAGSAAGVAMGLGRPLLTSRRRAAWFGPVAGVPAMIVLGPAAAGPLSTWGGAEWFGIVVTGAILGAVAGYQWWEPPPQPDDPVSRPPLTRRERKRRNREARRR